MYTLGDPLTDVSIVGPWPRCIGRSPRGGNGMQSSDLSSPRTIRTRSRVGSRISSGFFRSSPCVQPVLLGIHELTILISDAAGDRYPHGGRGHADDGCGYPRKGYRYPRKSYGCRNESCRHSNQGHGYPNNGCRHSNIGCGHTSKGVDGAGGCFRSEPLGRCRLPFIKTEMLTIV